MKDPLQDIMEERKRQDDKWGEQNHPDLYWLGILMEEAGELAKDIIEGKNPKKELVQVAAVALAWLEAIDRRYP
jgi:NTP pyrophosphatase (non-canonical NTP hydrolase)